MLRLRSRVLRFRDLGASFSRFGCFVLRSSFSSASFSKLPLLVTVIDRFRVGAVLASPERGTVLRLEVYERVGTGILLVEVHERVGKSVISMCMK